MVVNSNARQIILVCASDNNYAMPLAVTVRSTLANLKSGCNIVLYILDGGISPSNKAKITKSLNPAQIKIHWVTQDNSRFENLKLPQRVTVATYYRLLITEFLPQEFTKAIYLDSDMVVTGDLEELWNIDIENYHALAVQDDVVLNISMSLGLRNYQEVGIDPNGKYFNAGLLVINLEKWRSEKIGERVFEYMKENNDYARDDQDGLNAVLAGKWKELHPKWNQMPSVHKSSFRENSPFSEAVYNELLNEPCIIHFTLTPKPWRGHLRGGECMHPKKDLFFYYLDMTAWAGWRDTMLRRAIRKLKKTLKFL